MKTNLSREHRRILETTCAQARSAAEAGAERALHALAVGANSLVYDIDADLEKEADLFADCVVSDVAKNLIGIQVSK